MAGSLGTIYGQVKLDAAQAIAAFAAVKSASHSTSGAMKSAGETLSGVGKLTMGAGLAMVGGFALAVSAAATFEKKMDYVGAINHATAAQMELVRAKALQLGRDGQFSAGQIADGFVEMAKAGITTTQMIGGMGDAVVNLASAADVKLQTSVEDIVAQLHTYNLTTKEAGHVSDVLAGAMHASVISLDDMSTALKYAGPVANQLGISLDSTAQAMAILGKAGIKGSSAGTQLRQILVSLGGATKPANKELRALGIITKDGSNAFFDAHGHAKSLADIFQILQDHTKGLNQEQQLMAFRTIFNNRALASAAILTHSGAKGFAEMSAMINRTTAAEVAGKRLDNLSGDIQKLKGSLDTMMIQAGMPFQNMMRQLVQFINKVVNAFISLPKGVQSAIMWFLLIAGVLLTLMGAFTMIAGTILKFASTLKEVSAAFKLLGEGFKIAGSAMKLLNTSLLTSPIFWIIVAVIALAVGFYELYKHSKTFRDIINAIGSALSGAFKATINWLKGVPAFFEGLWKEITHWFEVGVGWVKKNWDILLAILTGPIGMVILIWRRFGSDIIKFFTAIPGEVSKFFSQAMSAVTGFFNKLPYYVGYAIGFVLGAIVRGFINIVTTMWKYGKMAVDGTISFFEKLPGEVANFFTEMWHDTVKLLDQFNTDVINFAITAYHSIINFFEKLPGEVANFFVDMWHRAVALFQQINAAVYNFAVSAYHSIISFFEKLPGNVANFFVDMWHRAVNLFNQIVSSAQQFGSNVLNGIINFLKGLPGQVMGIFNDVLNSFTGLISSAFDAAKNFAKGLWDGFKQGLGIHSPSYIERAMWAITDVTKTETARLGAHVRIMKTLAGQMNEVNPAKAAANLNTSQIATMTKQMTNQARLLQQAGSALFPSMGPNGVTSAASGISGLGVGGNTSNSTSSKNITVNVYNPTAEKASDSTAKKLRQLSDMGAL